MSFILQNYSRVSVSYNKDSFTTYNYINLADTIADMNADDYFITQQRSLNINDIIDSQASDGLVSLKITALSPAVTTQIVVQPLDENADLVLNTLQLKNLNGGGDLVVSVTPFGQEPELVDIAGLATVNGGIASGGSPDGTAVMQSTSTSFGWLPPRMTTAQRDAIAGAAEGLFIFNVSTDKMNVRAGGVWFAFDMTIAP